VATPYLLPEETRLSNSKHRLSPARVSDEVVSVARRMSLDRGHERCIWQAWCFIRECGACEAGSCALPLALAAGVPFGFPWLGAAEKRGVVFGSGLNALGAAHCCAAHAGSLTASIHATQPIMTIPRIGLSHRSFTSPDCLRLPHGRGFADWHWPPQQSSEMVQRGCSHRGHRCTSRRRA
jgi:hypothetical protein